MADSSDAAAVAVAVAGQPRRWTNLEGQQAGALRCPTKARCNTTELGHCTDPDRHLSHQRASERLESVYYLLNSLRSLDSSPVIVPLPHRLFINMRTCEHTRLCQTAEAYASPLGPLVGTQRGSAASSDRCRRRRRRTTQQLGEPRGSINGRSAMPLKIPMQRD